MSDTLNLHVDELHRDVVAVSADGPLHPDGAQNFKVLCVDLLGQGYKHLIVDLGGVGFLCSSGVGALLVVSEAFEGKGGAVFYVNLSKEATHVLKLLYLHEELNVRPSREAAFEELAELRHNL